MSEERKTIVVTGLWKTNLVLSIILALSALASAWVVIPYRVAAIEKRLDRIERRWNEQTELLIRIDERGAWMAGEVERLREE